MPIPNNKKDNNILVIDDVTYKFILDLEDEVGEDYRSFINKVLSSNVIKKKFILLQGLQRKISRLENMEGALDALCEHIKDNISELSPEQAVQFYQTLSEVYSNDTNQLKGLFIKLISHITSEKDNREL